METRIRKRVHEKSMVAMEIRRGCEEKRRKKQEKRTKQRKVARNDAQGSR
jgi:hypothetical protein